jgi:hypothetical protein
MEHNLKYYECNLIYEHIPDIKKCGTILSLVRGVRYL